ncbi:hypothetical protein CEP51_009791 [Fusarium floridanum]|uniref:Peptidase S8/S53 domain-containing protein n=1 Tax=Fusarium floridanum TaxID=1325733 RepID=A0A428RGG8_9HYPO|nr:hypothetical protein CEP51_009791 [Fusarium floridanum]
MAMRGGPEGLLFQPIHESLTLAALINGNFGMASGTTLDNASNPDWEYIRGAIWNDDPSCLLFNDRRENNHEYSTGFKWGLENKSGVEEPNWPPWIISRPSDFQATPKIPMDTGFTFAGPSPDAASTLQAKSKWDQKWVLKLPMDIDSLFIEAYQQDVRIHNDSWGDAWDKVAGQRSYEDDATSIDKFVHEHQDFIVLIAAGNDADKENHGESQIGDNGAAKNCITVGATGSTRSNDSFNTSMATSLVASYAALMRKASQEKRKHHPSAALIKALLVNGAINHSRPNGPGFDYEQGFGLADVDTSTDMIEKGTFVDGGNKFEKSRWDAHLLSNIRKEDEEWKSHEIALPSGRHRLTVRLAYPDPKLPLLQNNVKLIVGAGGEERDGNMGNDQGFDKTSKFAIAPLVSMNANCGKQCGKDYLGQCAGYNGRDCGS